MEFGLWHLPPIIEGSSIGFQAPVPEWVLETRTVSKFEYQLRALLKAKANAKITIISCWNSSSAIFPSRVRRSRTLLLGEWVDWRQPRAQKLQANAQNKEAGQCTAVQVDSPTKSLQRGLLV